MSRRATPATSADDDTSLLRRRPSQRRSRERLETLLAAATALIAESGSDAMRMSEVAERAGVSIGSLYQYFPDKAAIIRTLFDRYNAQGRTCIEDELAGVRDMADLGPALGRLVDGFYAMFMDEPAMRDIWSGVQADKTLQAMDLAETRLLGSLLADLLARLRPEADRAELDVSAFLTMHLVGATVRLAVSVAPTEADAFIVAFKRMLLKELLPR